MPRDGRRSEASGPTRKLGWAVAVFTVLLGGGMIAAAVSEWAGGLAESNVRLRVEVGSLADKNGVLDESVGFLESVRDRLLKKNSTAKAGRRLAESRSRELEGERNQLTGEVAKLNGAVDVLMDKLTSSRVRITSLEQVALERDNRIGELEGTRDRLVVVNFDLKRNLAAVKTETEEMRVGNRELRGEIETLARRRDELHEKVESLTRRNIVRLRENDALQNRVMNLDFELERKTLEINAFQNEIAAMEARTNTVASSDGVEKDEIPLVLE